MCEGSEKVALVFGGSRGIGAAIVSRLASDGYAVAFTYASNHVSANETVNAVKASGGEALAIRADSTDAGQIQAAVAQAVARFEKIDAVVVNAGAIRMGTIDTVPLDDLDLLLNVNVRGVYLGIQACVPHLNDGGRVVTIGSNVAIRSGFPGASVYQMTKGAVAAMIKGIALDLAPRRITVNNVQPGPTDTDMNVGNVDVLSGLVPLNRVATPAEIAGLVSYIAGSEAGFMTGASVTIDGGYTL